MKTTLLSALMALLSIGTFAQAPTIEGDTMLCPESDGTATIVTNQAYDSYQWQWRWNFGTSSFQDAPGATTSQFTYGQVDFSVTRIRVRVTLNGETYFSNELEIDGYTFLPIFTIQNFDPEQVSTGPNGELLLCDGAAVIFSVGMPYTTSIQWFRDGNPINGATSQTLTVTAPGNYHVSAAPQICPGYVATSLPTTVQMDPDCNLATGSPNQGAAFAFFPNPAMSDVHFTADSPVLAIEIFDISGKKLLSGQPQASTGTMDISTLSTGVYVMQVTTAKGSTSYKLAKY